MKKFKWTDKLVKEFIVDRNNGKSYAPVYVDDYIKQFKKSKKDGRNNRTKKSGLPVL